VPRNGGELLARFVSAFKRGIEGELAAMRESAETFELALAGGEDLGGLRYSFEPATADRLAAGSVAVLKSSRAEQRVVIERIADDRIVVLADQAIDVAAPCALVIAPWFLYDRLIAALDEISAAPLALMLFGKQPPARVASELRLDHGELDPSQRAAVQLCADSELAFVWGPPGTGKTATLVHVIDELLAKGERILVASTTNAAIDQLLAKLAARPGFAPGVFVRLGRSDADTFGAELADIVGARQHAQRDRLAKLRSRIGEVEQQLRYLRALVAELAPALTTQQSLFAEQPPKLRAAALSRVFAAADAIAAQGARDQLRAVETRIVRLDRVRELAKRRAIELGAELRGIEARVVAEARVILCTLTATYVSPLLATERFDALIAEEAGMATLPPLFYAASRCDRRAIMVGDPRQLPPIVQSNDDAVRRAIGRNIFDVTVPDPAASSIVAMLGVQYRMHASIGALVGSLFYAGRLVHRAAADVAEIAARAPFAGRAVVIDDVASTCERSAKGSSRINAISAARIADLALETVRGGTRSIGVITPYAAQASEVRRLLALRGIADAAECSTIHRFQGRECDVVLIDLVDAQPMRPSALVADAPNLLNVSISRARGKLVIVADVAYWNAAAPDGMVAAMLREAMRA
jgi:hypothetical protein